MSKKLSPIQYLFWDVNTESLDVNQNGFVIERVLEKGRMEDVVWLFSNYAKDEIASVVKYSKNLSSKTGAFWSLILR